MGAVGVKDGAKANMAYKSVNQCMLTRSAPEAESVLKISHIWLYEDEMISFGRVKRQF